MADVAYKPPVKVNQTKTAVTKTYSAPPYEDAGVKYQGFSKLKLPNGDYLLNQQVPFNYTETTGTITNSLNQYTIQSPPKGKKLFITSVQVCLSITSSTTSSYFSITNLPTSNIVFKAGLLRSGWHTFNFPVPLVITSEYDDNVVPSGCQIRIYSGNPGVVAQCVYSLQGWTE